MIITIQLWLLGIIIIILLLLLLISNIFVFFFFASSSNKVSLNWFTWFSWWNVDADCFFINWLIWHPWIWDHMTLTFKIYAAIYWLSLGTSIQESIEVIPIGFHCAWAQVHGFKQKLEIEDLKKEIQNHSRKYCNQRKKHKCRIVRVPNCLGAEMSHTGAEVSWCRIVPVPKCLAFANLSMRSPLLCSHLY